MPWTAQEYLDRMQTTRAAHLRNIDTTGKRIQGIYMQAAKDLADKAASAKEGSLTERWASDYQRALQRRMEQMRGELGLAITGGMRASARLPGETVEAWLDDALALCGVDGSFTGVLSGAPDDALRALLDGRMYRDGKSLSRRIWDKTAYLQGSIEDILAQGIAQHRSALELARDLEAYVNPKAKMPVSWLKLYPTIPFDRQIDYNAQRLARTAINHAYWAAGIETAQKNPFCQAMHWQLSPSHFERQVARFGEDVCDTYASHDEGLGRGNWPIQKVPMPHAQCLCATWQVVPPIRDVADRLGRWVDGGEDAALDKAFGAWKAERGSPAQSIAVAAQTKPESVKQRMGRMDKAMLEKRFGPLRTDETILTANRRDHIEQRHSDAVGYFDAFGADIIQSPNDVIVDPKNPKTVLVLGKRGDVWLNVAVRLATPNDTEEITKNSVITCMRLRETNAQKAIKKAENDGRILYKKE